MMNAEGGEGVDEIGGMGGKLRDMEKASIIMELLARLIRPDEKKKIRVVLEYDPETGVMHGTRDVIQDEE